MGISNENVTSDVRAIRVESHGETKRMKSRQFVYAQEFEKLRRIH